MPFPKSIIFGSTGAVGSATARHAASLGIPIVLAMRDTAKPIPGLPSASQLERVHADLSKSDSIVSAVTSTGATQAFVYALSSSPDHMLSTMKALKNSGISLVVFLSSFTVRETGSDLQETKPTQVIPYFHAQIEVTLEEVFGVDGFVALRPGAFASNMLQYKSGVAAGRVSMQGRKSYVDNIAPEDIGRVAAAILANGPPAVGGNRLYLYGPKITIKEESVQIVAKVLGKSEIEVVGPNKEDAFKYMVEEKGMSSKFARYMSDQSAKDEDESSDKSKLKVFGYGVEEGQLQNVERLTGKPAAGFEEWVRKNKELFMRSED